MNMDELRAFKGIWIPAEIWLDDKLTVMEKVLYAEIDSFCSRGRECFANNAHFAKMLQVSERQIQRLLVSLEEKGVISRRIIYKEGTKEVDKRYLKAIPPEPFDTTPPDINVTTPGDTHVTTPGDTHVTTPPDNIVTPPPDNIVTYTNTYITNTNTNSSVDMSSGEKLNPAEEKAKSEFESKFHALTKLDELETIKAYVGDYGVKSVLRAIDAASKSKVEPWDRARLSPKYLLPILQREDEKASSPSKENAVPAVSAPDMSWIPHYATDEENRELGRRLREQFGGPRKGMVV